MSVVVEGFTRLSAAVFETTADPVAIGDSHVVALIEAARSAPTMRARLLLHLSRDDSLHEMVIALPSQSCDPPHINFRSGKSFLALSGQFAVVLCSDDGTRFDPVVLSAGPWPGARLLRLRAPMWHTIIPLQGDTVFLETIIGPFTGNKFAKWFPAEGQERMQAAERIRKSARGRAAEL